MPVDPPAANPLWNTPHLLQTEAWGALKTGFGWQWLTVAETVVLLRRLPLGLTLAYIPRGPRLAWDDPAAAAAALAAVHTACRARGAIFLKIEPDLPDTPAHTATLAGLGFHPSPQTIQPRRSLIVDLRGTEEDVLGRMRQKTRYNIRLAPKKQVTCRATDDVAAFNALLQVTGRRDGFGVHTPAYYEAAYARFHPSGQCALFLAEYAGAPLAGVMAFHLAGRAWYFYGASSDHERQRMAPYLAQWEAMRWARAQGAQVYDLWGVPDEDEAALEAGFETRSDGLWGVYRFKRGWGGHLVRTVGAWDRPYQPALYQAYRLYLRLRRTSLS